MRMTADQLKQILDVALLKPTATAAEIETLAGVVRQEAFGQICVNPFHVSRAAAGLAGSAAKVVACVGFPMGAVPTETKVFETQRAIADGAQEIDMVLNLGAFLGDDRSYAEADVRAVVQAAAGAPVKVILETPFLNRRQKIDAARLAQNAGASFVKTCTGFSPDPLALYEDIRLLRETIGPAMGLKASGRVGNAFRVVSLLEAGANRFGLILEQAREILRGWDETNQDRL
jgi:deoxyribose-phosphate aldolase